MSDDVARSGYWARNGFTGGLGNGLAGGLGNGLTGRLGDFVVF